MSITHNVRFSALTKQLNKFSSIWRSSPFLGTPLSWQLEHPCLSQALLDLDDVALEQLDSCPDALHHFIAEHLAEFEDLLPLIKLPRVEQNISTDKFASRSIPGRKWQQITSFLGASENYLQHDSLTELVDWCAGKSHLGRTAATITNTNLCAIERDEQLCVQGQQLAEQVKVAAKFLCADVLQQQFEFKQNQQILALHACGDLHRKLVNNWQESDSKSLVLAPCCYEKWLKEDYKPLSIQGQQHNLALKPSQIRLAVQESVTAHASEQAKMHLLKIYRLAFDTLQRDIRGIDEYLPTPSLPISSVNQGAKQVLELLAEKKKLAIPTHIDVATYVEIATERYKKVRRLQLAGQGFRRALELWLLCDMALYLEQAGCTVVMQEFCARELSPRNIQLIATR